MKRLFARHALQLLLVVSVCENDDVSSVRGLRREAAGSPGTPSREATPVLRENSDVAGSSLLVTVWDHDSLADRAIPSPASRVLLHGDLPAVRAPNRDEFPALPYSQVPRWIRFMSPPSDIDAQDNDAQDPGALYPLPPPPWNLRPRSPQWILSLHLDLRFRSRVLSTPPRPLHPQARAPNIFPLEPIFFKELRHTKLSSRDGDLTLVPQCAPQAGTVPTHTRRLSPSLDPPLLAPGRSAPSGYVPPVTPCPSPLPNPLALSPLPPPRPCPLPRFKPTLTFPQLARLQPPPSPLPTPLTDLPATLWTASNVASPSTSPTSPLPVPTAFCHPRPARPRLYVAPQPAFCPLIHARPRTCLLPAYQPSTSPFSIAQSYFSPIAHSPPRPEAHTSTPQPCPFPPPTPDPVPPSNQLPESSSRRRKRRHRGLVGTATPRIAHGTVRGSWSKSQLVKALSSLCDTPSQLKFTRLPGCGAHSQLRFPWKGTTVLVNTWHTGRVHLQGFGACDLARQLSEMSPSTSRVRTRSSSPGSTGDSSGVGNNPSWVGRNLCLTLFMWIIHLGILLGSGFLGGFGC